MAKFACLVLTSILLLAPQTALAEYNPGAQCQAAEDAVDRVEQAVYCAAAAEQWGEKAADASGSKALAADAKFFEAMYLLQACGGNLNLRNNEKAYQQMVAVRRLLGEVAVEGIGRSRKRAREVLATTQTALRDIQGRMR